ncbi:uncharacterized protein GIQ15_01467 [Arthroderma uncinatum]|uniref:uncharacterized protein n=1 Tax=Arthroderma uncinatum TaxID=74035 RepID=UPI00144ADF65|nr:uncharacterized protein GIQ15_01467 [Arthroderma uncinatum]KAF3491950.1 hypothetical protein GIQ15_01467 [Arthroderma uncinatum]
MELFKGLNFRHRARAGANNGPHDEEDVDQGNIPFQSQQRQRQPRLEPKKGGGQGNTPAALKEPPEDIKQSISAVKTFLAARMAMRCHSCEANITEGFCVRDWTQDARGIGYADGSMSQHNPFAALFYDGPGPPPGSLHTPLQFQGADKKTDEFVGKVFDFVSELIPGPANKNLPPELHGMLRLGLLLDKVAELLRNDSLDDVTKRAHVYSNVFDLVGKLASHPELVDLVRDARYHKQQTPGLEALSAASNSSHSGSPLVLGEKIASVRERLKQLARQSAIVLEASGCQDLTTRSGENLLDCCERVVAIYTIIAEDESPLEEARRNSSATPQEKWEAFHQKHGVSRDEAVFEQSHAYYHRALAMMHSGPGRIKRMVTEVANMSTSLPIGIFVKVSESRPDMMRCLIMGPPDSPYGYALFETAFGSIINPNLHPDGKVCLSLLGTWHDGDAAAQWQPGKSTILSVLISIQAMIFTEDPWRNEPAFTSAVGTIADMQARKYVEKIHPRVITAGMLHWLFKPGQRHGIWEKEVRAHFRYNGAKMIANVEKWAIANPALKSQGLVQELKRGLEDISRR